VQKLGAASPQLPDTALIRNSSFPILLPCHLGIELKKCIYFRRGLLFSQNNSFDLAIRSSPSNVNDLR